MKLSAFLVALLSFQTAIAQSVGIGTSTPDPSARLQINSTQGFYYYAGGAWINLTNGVQANNLGIAVSSSYGITTTLAGSGLPDDIDGTGTAAYFYNPNGVAVDANKNKVRKIIAR
jgi:hypothetical protein